MAPIEIPAEVAAYVAGLITADGELPADDVERWIRTMGLGTWPGAYLLQAADVWMRSRVSASARQAIDLVGQLERPGRPRG